MVMAAMKRRRDSAHTLRGSMEVAIPALIVAILAAFVLYSYWELLPAWAAWPVALVIGALGLFGLRFLGHSGGMAANMERMEREKRD